MDVVSDSPDLTDGLASRTGKQSGATWLGALAIFLLTCAVHLPLLGNPPLAGTEGHRVFPSLEMVRSGDWVLPRLYGQLYLIKPPLHDWLIAIAQILSGNHGNEFVWRLPSVIGAAFLNVALYLFGARWFGRIGGIVSGICGLGLIALWGQARTADVDGTNTLACSIAALCMIELLFGRPVRRLLWIVGAGVALGATLMTKGPAGLPLIIGVLVWAALRPLVASYRNPAPPAAREPSRGIGSLEFWLPVVIGAALFGLYASIAWRAVHRLSLPPDYSGLEETGNQIIIRSFHRLGQALLVPPSLFAFSLPVSVALVLVFVRGYRRGIKASEVEGGAPRLLLVDALAASVLISWGVCLLSGMVNPRYGYVTFAPLCLLGGAVAASIPYQSIGCASFFRGAVLACVVVLAGANWFIALWLAWKGGAGHVAMTIAAVLAFAIAVATYRRLMAGPGWNGAWGLVLLLVLVAVPFAYLFRIERNERSGYQASQWLVKYIGGSDQPVLTGAVLHSQPELFYYAGLHPVVVPTFALQDPARYPGGTWLVLDKEEYARWMGLAPSRISDRPGGQPATARRFLSHKYVAYVAWYSKAPATQPTTQP